MTWLVLAVLLGSAPEAETDEALATGRLLRCPVCQGMSVAESPSEMAQAMMGRVRELHSEGKSRAEVLDYFVARYGDWVLLTPPARGFNWLVWLLPPGALCLGLGLWLRYGRRPRRVAPSAPPPETDDPYVRAIRERL